MRRRLTVTGASDTIDGVSKLSVSEPEVTKVEPPVCVCDIIIEMPSYGAMIGICCIRVLKSYLQLLPMFFTAKGSRPMCCD
jgi:hypothetical protein